MNVITDTKLALQRNKRNRASRLANGQPALISHAQSAAITKFVNKLMVTNQVQQHIILPILTCLGEVSCQHWLVSLGEPHCFRLSKSARYWSLCCCTLSGLMASLSRCQLHPPVHGSDAQMNSSFLSLVPPLVAKFGVWRVHLCCVRFSSNPEHMTTT